jgi:hypothetical protein
MSEPFFNPQKVAANALNRFGLAVIWQLHLSAAKAYRKGNDPAVWLIIDVADTAERVWLRCSYGCGVRGIIGPDYCRGEGGTRRPREREGDDIVMYLPSDHD